MKTHTLCSVTVFRKSYRLWDNVVKYARDRQATNGDIIQRMRFAWWLTKATETHSEYVIPLFRGNSLLRESSWFYIIRTSVACLVVSTSHSDIVYHLDYVRHLTTFHCTKGMLWNIMTGLRTWRALMNTLPHLRNDKALGIRLGGFWFFKASPSTEFLHNRSDSMHAVVVA